MFKENETCSTICTYTIDIIIIIIKYRRNNVWTHLITKQIINIIPILIFKCINERVIEIKSSLGILLVTDFQ